MRRIVLFAIMLFTPLILLADPLGSKAIGDVLMVFLFMLAGAGLTFLYILLLFLLKKDVIARSWAMTVWLPLLLIACFAVEHIYISILPGNSFGRFYFGKGDSLLFSLAFLILPLGAAFAFFRLLRHSVLSLRGRTRHSQMSATDDR